MAQFSYTYLFSDEESLVSLRFGDADLISGVDRVPEAVLPGFDASDYAAQFQGLMPFGAAWSVDATSQLGLLLASFADELGRADARAIDLLTETDPRLSSELLPDFERLLGLPDTCVTSPLTVGARRAAVEARLTNIGGQSRAFFRSLASRLGYQITIDEFKTESDAIAAGIAYTGTSWAHTWRINAAEQTVRDFLVGEGTVGEALRSWGNEQLECSFNRLKPAHTVLLFAYA